MAQVEHPHESCSPDPVRDLVVTGLVDPVAHDAVARTGSPRTAAGRPSRTVSPVIDVTPFTLPTEVIARSEQVPVVVLLGSPVDPGMSALRRSLVGRVSPARLRWILATVDADRFPRVVASFRPRSLPTVTVVAGGTGVASWTPEDALGDRGVDCPDWVEATVSTVATRLSGLPEDTVVGSPSQAGDGAGGADTGHDPDPRLRRAADLVGEGRPEAAVDLYDRMLEDRPGPDERRTLSRARAAVGVLVRTKNLDRAAVFTALAVAEQELRQGPGQGSRRADHGDLSTLLRAADVLVLADRPDDAVDLLSASLTGSPAGSLSGSLSGAEAGTGAGSTSGRPAGWSAVELGRLRSRLLDLVLLLDEAAPATVRARTRLASSVF